MNTHLQLLWNSVFAPKAAVDLAKQHPNIYNLGWTYVWALIVATLVCDIAVLNFVRPLLGIVVAQSSGNFAWADSLTGLTVLSVMMTAFLFVGQRRFWQVFDSKQESLPAIDSAIIAGVALSLLMLIPVYVFNEMVLNASTTISLLSLLLLVFLIGFFLYFSTIYFSHALKMAWAKSFWLNVLFLILMALFYVSLFIIGAIISSTVSGTPLNLFFEF